MDKFDKRNVELLPDEMEMLFATELTQYYMQSWSIEFHNNGTANRKKYFNTLYIVKMLNNLSNVHFK